MKRFGLIGYPLTHSFSMRYFSEKFRKEKIRNCLYSNYPLGDIREFPGLLNSRPVLSGLNVTIPYKESVIPYLDKLSEEAAAIGAVNTILIRDGRTEGFNTDVYGFTKALEPFLQPSHRNALVLGSGGAAKAVCYALEKMDIHFRIISRKPEGEGMTGYDEITDDLLRQHTLVVNTTPLGMYPHTGSCPPIPYDMLTSQHLLFDLVYNPSETLFMKKGKEQGATVVNGMEMLRFQAEKSWEIWNG